MDETVYKNFSTKFWNMLKNVINGQINCTPNIEKDTLYITISRLGIEYETSVKEMSKCISDVSFLEKEFDKVIKRYRSWVLHKYFYD